MASPSILFTAFEPSGDEHAAPVIAALREAAPDATVWATGGTRMAQAGAHLIERTTGNATMMGDSLGKVRQHLAFLSRLKVFLKKERVDVLVAVDSPAANWSVCAAVRKLQPHARVVHLVCPQIWAWGGWRIRKLRGLTDHVLCLLPFEPAWLQSHGVRGTFVGHPAYSHPTLPDPAARAALPQGRLKLALLPGSRPGEIAANGPMMWEVFARLTRQHPDLIAAVAAYDDDVVKGMNAYLDRRPDAAVLRPQITQITGHFDAILDWADLALTVSGTATLHVARHGKPMVAVYNASWWGWTLFAQFVVSTRTFTLPNLISEWQGDGRAILELAPHFGDPAPAFAELDLILRDPAEASARQAALARVNAAFAGHDFGKEAGAAVLEAALKPGRDH